MFAGFLLSANGQTCPELDGLRSRFLDHGTYDQAMETADYAAQLWPDASEECRPYVEAHQWISHARSADFGWDMLGRLTRFNDGIARLDSLVAAHPGDDVLCALRLSVSGTAPRFLGADAHWAQDAEAAIRVSTTDFWVESPKFSAWMVELALDIQSKTRTEE